MPRKVTPNNSVTPPQSTELSVDAITWKRLVAIHAHVQGAIERVLHRRFGLGLSEVLALAACAAADDGEMRMQDLAEAVHLDQSSVSRLVGRLESSGLTERRLCQYDRRGVYTGITELGLDTLRQVVPIYEAALQDAFGRLEYDPALGGLMQAIRTGSRAVA